MPGSAQANGDPASDVLLTDKVFLPFEAPISASAKSDLQKTVDEATAKGYPIRVAVIAFTGDLGTAVSLWGSSVHPQQCLLRHLGGQSRAWVHAMSVTAPAVLSRHPVLLPAPAGVTSSPAASQLVSRSNR